MLRLSGIKMTSISIISSFYQFRLYAIERDYSPFGCSNQISSGVSQMIEIRFCGTGGDKCILAVGFRRLQKCAVFILQTYIFVHYTYTLICCKRHRKKAVIKPSPISDVDSANAVEGVFEKPKPRLPCSVCELTNKVSRLTFTFLYMRHPI